MLGGVEAVDVEEEERATRRGVAAAA